MPTDYITKISNVMYNKDATCDRWVKFISEIITDNEENAKFLQKSFGYALSGGDKYTGRFLNENPIEFIPEFKIFINTNHLPRVNDDTIFSSERVKIFPFERHFEPNEQDTGLKGKFREEEMMSGILNWLIDGYRLLKIEGLQTTDSVMRATQEYREESDIIGTFLKSTTCIAEKSRIQTSKLYKLYKEWCNDNGYRIMSLNNLKKLSQNR